MLSTLYAKMLQQRSQRTQPLVYDDNSSTQDFKRFLTQRDRQSILRRGKTARTKFKMRYAR